jgi:hypothetical protein
METVIGAFDDRHAAKRAVERLVQSGFAREDVHIEHGAEAGAMQDGGTGSGTQDRWQGMEAEVAIDRNLLSSIGQFFTRLFGQDHPSGHVGVYSEAVRRGSTVVVVDAADEQQAAQAASLLHELGAIDIDERTSQWRAGGWAGSQPSRSTTGGVGAEQEELKLGTRDVDRGGVRVVQRVTQQPLREIVRLREEYVVVEQGPADRVAAADAERIDGSSSRSAEEERAYAADPGSSGRPSEDKPR